MKKSLTFLIVLFVSINLYSQTTGPVMWSFAGSSPGATFVPDGVSAGNATFGGGLANTIFKTRSTGGQVYSASTWTGSSTTRGTTDYIEFCIENNSGLPFDIENFIFDESRNLKGPKKWDLTYTIGTGTETNMATSQASSGTDAWANHDVATSISLLDDEIICFRIYGYDAQTGNSNGTWAFDDVIISGTGAIPINLLNFNASKESSNTILNWQTLTETNNDYFSLEWSRDGKNFEEIANLDGAGTSREKQVYNYTHTNPTKGINYYRLSQFDLNGRNETFKIVSVYLDIDNVDMQIIPNRVNSVLRIDFNQDLGEGQIQIYNIEGRIVANYELLKGENEFKIDVTNINSGQYFVRYIGNSKVLTKKFIKL